jgi:hypothetical protein
MPEKWNSSADKYETYATPRTANGSTTANEIRIKYNSSYMQKTAKNSQMYYTINNRLKLWQQNPMVQHSRAQSMPLDMILSQFNLPPILTATSLNL